MLCLAHHKGYDTFRFSIHHEVIELIPVFSIIEILDQSHKIFAFHPAVARLHGLEVTTSWTNSSEQYPPPHATLLKDHFMSAIYSSLKASEEVEEADDIDDDDHHCSVLIEDLHERVTHWVDNSSQWIGEESTTMASSSNSDRG